MRDEAIDDGLTVRFFSMKIPNGHCRTGCPTGNILTGKWDATDFGTAVRKLPGGQQVGSERDG